MRRCRKTSRRCRPRLSAARGHPAKAGARWSVACEESSCMLPRKEVVYGKVVVTFETGDKNQAASILLSVRIDLAIWRYKGYFFPDPSRPDFGSCGEKTSGIESKRSMVLPPFEACRRAASSIAKAASLACCRSAIRPGAWGASTVSTVSSSGGRAGMLRSAEGQAPPRRSRGTRQLRAGSTRGGVRGAFRSASGGE